MVKHLLRQLLALGTGPALGNIGINTDETAIRQGGTAHIQPGAVRPHALEMMRLVPLGPRHQRLDHGLRIAAAVFAALGVETENIRQRHRHVGHQPLRNIKQAQKFLIEQLQLQILVDQADRPRNRLEQTIEQTVLIAQSLLAGLAFRDVGVGRDEAGQLAGDKQWFALGQMSAAARSGVLDAMGLETQRHRRDALDVRVDIARAILAAGRDDANQVGEMGPVKNRLNRQTENTDEPRIPHPQVEILVKYTDALRHAGHDGLEVGIAPPGVGRVREIAFRKFHAVALSKGTKTS
jgi:hypothetical protein